MGRIADALKKAQSDHEAKLRFGIGGPTAVPIVEEAAPPMERIRGRPPKDGPGIPEIPLRQPIPVHGPATMPLGPMPDWDIDPLVVTLRERETPVSEQFRAVRTWLMSRTATAERCCYAMTSSIPNEGTTVAAANLAGCLSEVRHLRILLVDANLRSRALAGLFKMTEQPGLADILAGRCGMQDAIRKTPISNFDILPSGVPGKLNPAELFSIRAAPLLFEELRERYHFILVDTPAVQSASDIGIIGSFCTGVLVVVRIKRTPSHLVRQSVRWLQAHNLNVIGCIAAGHRHRTVRPELHAGDA